LLIAVAVAVRDFPIKLAWRAANIVESPKRTLILEIPCANVGVLGF